MKRNTKYESAYELGYNNSMSNAMDIDSETCEQSLRRIGRLTNQEKLAYRNGWNDYAMGKPKKYTLDSLNEIKKELKNAPKQLRIDFNCIVNYINKSHNAKG